MKRRTDDGAGEGDGAEEATVVYGIDGKPPKGFPRTGRTKPSNVQTELAACQVPDWRLSDDADAPQLGLRTVRHGDTVLINGDDDNAAPFIGVVHQIYMDKAGDLMLRVSWLYRPKEVVARGAKLRPEEVMYSRHFDDVDAHTVMHPCQVMFLPEGSEIPKTVLGDGDENLHERQVPGFLCCKVWDYNRKKLFPIRAKERAVDLIDLDDQMAATELKWLTRQTKERLEALAKKDEPKRQRLRELERGTAGAKQVVKAGGTGKLKAGKEQLVRPQPTSMKGERALPEAAAVNGAAAAADDAGHEAKRPRTEHAAPGRRTPTPPPSRSASPFDEFPPQRTREASRAAEKMASAIRQKTEQFSETARVRVYDQLQELLKLAGKEAEPLDDPERQRPEMKPEDMLQAELAARMQRPDALDRLLQSIKATSQTAAEWLTEMGLLRLLGAWLRVLRILPPGDTADEVREVLIAMRTLPYEKDHVAWSIYIQLGSLIQKIINEGGSATAAAKELKAMWRHRVRSFNLLEAPAAASEKTESQLAPQESDLNERWTAALSAADRATAATASAAPAVASKADVA